MKTVYSFLIILITLSLLDGTPIHNHHGKFISCRSRSTQLSFETFATTDSEQCSLAGISSDNDYLTEIPSGEFRTISRQRAFAIPHFHLRWSQPVPVVALYALGCLLRI